MRCCWHAARVDRLHLLSVREDVGELAGEEALFVRSQLKVCQGRDTFHVIDREGGSHGRRCYHPPSKRRHG